jgi:hypothetical protein
MSELEINGQGTNYNSGTHQREPILHVHRPLSSSGGSGGGGVSDTDGETVVIVAFIILLCIVGVILYFAIKYAIKGIKGLVAYIQERRAQREAERAKIAQTHYEELCRLVAPLEELAPIRDGPAASASAGVIPQPRVQKPKTEAEIRTEAESIWDARLLARRRGI